ncbi:putative EGF-like domain protein, partial [Trichinella nativa]
PCNNMQCDVFACVHEEHLDCVDVRVQTCTELQGLVHCTEHCNKLFPKISYKEFEAKCKENGGFANMSEADKSCVCYNAQLYGDLCKTVHDPCSDEEICKNNGICESNGTHHTCDCLENFSGKDCTEIISQCSSNNDCKNFGTCVSHETGRSCNCLSGFFGVFCEFKAGYCMPATCQNGGACIQVTNVLLKCVCPEGYDGTFCELHSERRRLQMIQVKQLQKCWMDMKQMKKILSVLNCTRPPRVENIIVQRGEGNGQKGTEDRTFLSGIRFILHNHYL